MKNIAFSDYDMRRRSSFTTKLCSKSAFTAIVLVTGLVLVYWYNISPTTVQRNLTHQQDLKWLQTLIDSKLLKDNMESTKNDKLQYHATTTTDFERVEDWGIDIDTDTVSTTARSFTETQAANLIDITTVEKSSTNMLARGTSPNFKEMTDSTTGAHVHYKSTFTSPQASKETTSYEIIQSTQPRFIATTRNIGTKSNEANSRAGEWLNMIRGKLGVGSDDTATDRKQAILKQLGFLNFDRNGIDINQKPIDSTTTDNTEGELVDKNMVQQNVADIGLSSDHNIRQTEDIDAMDTDNYQQRVSDISDQRFNNKNNLGDSLQRQYVSNTVAEETEQTRIDMDGNRKPMYGLGYHSVDKKLNAFESPKPSLDGSAVGVSINTAANDEHVGEGIQSIIRGNFGTQETVNEAVNEKLRHVSVSDIRSSSNDTESSVRKQTEKPYAVRPVPLNYPKYIDIFSWNQAFKTDVATECVPMQTISSFVRVCIHSLEEDSDVSTFLKGRGAWEFMGVRDVQLAILNLGDDSGLVDLGAGIGVYSLAVASLHRQVVAVEPYLEHVQMFQRSVILNKLQPYVTLARNVISDTQESVLIEHSSGHLNDVNIRPYKVDVDRSAENVVQSITLNDLGEIVPFKKVVLKVDIPGFVHAALKRSTAFFSKLDVQYVFIHWDNSDRQLCHYILSYFMDLKYTPYFELHGKALDTRHAFDWQYKSIIWVKK